MKGGYAMLDCTGLDLIKGMTPQTITGIYNRVKTAYNANKPIYCFNAHWDDKGIVTPIQVMVIDFGEYFIATASTLQIVVGPNDSIVIRNMAPEN